jgi:hypothetical protein
VRVAPSLLCLEVCRTLCRNPTFYPFQPLANQCKSLPPTKGTKPRISNSSCHLKPPLANQSSLASRFDTVGVCGSNPHAPTISF